MSLPARVLVPVHTIGLGRKGDYVGPAIAIDVGDGDLIIRREVVNQVTLDLDRRGPQEGRDHDGQHGHGGPPGYGIDLPTP
jgi:hypothetical protein